jgi:putative transposase
MQMFDDLTDNEWALVQELFDGELAPSSRCGRPPVEARTVVNAVLWVLASGGTWAKLPGRYTSPKTCRRRFEKWQADGTFAEIVRRLGTTGREISLPGKIRLKSARPPAQSLSDRLRGAFWTDPASRRTGLTAQYRQSD